MPKTKNAKKINKYLIKIIDELIYTTDTKNIFNCYASDLLLVTFSLKPCKL